MIDIFLKKQAQLNDALYRIDLKLDWFKENQENLPHNILKTWNNWHDLNDRIKDRVFENVRNYKIWHWEQYGFNTY
jgi:hypothetical protein